MPIARYVDGAVVDRRPFDLSSIPQHKVEALGWKTLIEAGEGPVEEISVDGDTITITRSTPAPTKTQLLERSAAKRWEIETGGIVVNGAPVPTDERTRGVLTAGYVKATADANYQITDWKVGPGVYTTLDAATIIHMANEVEAHVQACFSANKAVDIKINDNTYTTYAQVNEAAEWPVV